MAEIEKLPKSRIDYDRDKQINDVFSLKIRKATGIVEAIGKMSKNTGISRNAYIIEAIREKLQRDGYLPSAEE